MRALEAAEELEKEGIELSVLYVTTIKQTISDEVGKDEPPVLTAENHSVIDGLGEAVRSYYLRNR